jgi:hypothetical protein
MRRVAILILTGMLFLACAGPALAGAQTQTQAKPKPAAQPPSPVQAPVAVAQEPTPTPESLGVPSFHPAMHYLESYDAGGGQRFYLFGADVPFAEVVAYYQKLLKVKGELVFDQPATHMFDIGRFQEATMAFPPSLTVKDYTWGGMQGYANPRPNAQPANFKTIVQIVPMPAATPPPPIKK